MARPKAPAPTQALLTRFDELHRQYVRAPAVIQGGKDAALIARLYRSHGDDLVRELMADFFASSDPFIRNSGYSVGVFVSQAAKLLAHRARRRPESWIDECERLHQGACASSAAHYWRKDTEA